MEKTFYLCPVFLSDLHISLNTLLNILCKVRISVRVIVFSATFNNILNSCIVVVSFIGGGNWSTWRKATDKLYHIMLYRVHLARAGFELTIFVVIGTDCIGSFKSNYHTVTTTT